MKKDALRAAGSEKGSVSHLGEGKAALMERQTDRLKVETKDETMDPHLGKELDA